MQLTSYLINGTSKQKPDNLTITSASCKINRVDILQKVHIGIVKMKCLNIDKVLDTQ